MSRTNPVRRPVLPRSQPIRHFAGVFGARPASSGPPDQNGTRGRATRADKADRAGKNGAAPSAKNGAPKKSGAAPGAAVARGVNAGYRVIEEYLRQGQDFARSLWPNSESGGGGTTDAPMNMTERLIRSASDLAGLFSEFLQTFSMPGTLPPPGSMPIPDFGIGHARDPVPVGAAAHGRSRNGPNRATTSAADNALNAPAAQAWADVPTAISVDLQSRQRAEVTVDLRPGSSAGTLQVHDLRAPRGPGRLTGITATHVASERRVVVTVTVPDDQPVGAYSGLIVDAETNLPRGTIAVRVFATVSSASQKQKKPVRAAKATGRKAARPPR
jgi:hypothetical protein